MKYRVLTINPEYNNTVVALFDDEKKVCMKNILHPKKDLSKFTELNDQLEYRKEKIIACLKEEKIKIDSIDAFVGRGGGLVSCEAGTYIIGPTLLKHSRLGFTVQHPAILGSQLAYALAAINKKPSYIVNPPDVDEFIMEARLTGIKGIYHEARAYALEQKEVSLRYAKVIKKDYSQLNLIVACLDTGFSIAAHRKGKMIDSNDVINGDGPMALNRAGDVPAKSLANYVLNNNFNQQDAYNLITENGGLKSLLGTDDFDVILGYIKNGDEHTITVFNSMIYQIVKEIGSLYGALKGECDVIIITGELAKEEYLIGKLKEYLKFVKVEVFPGSYLMEGMAAGAIRVLSKEEEALEYTGKPIFEAFK